MPQYLQILEGPSPEEAEPILATTDENLIRAVAAAISARLSPEAIGGSKKLKLIKTKPPTAPVVE